MVSPFDIEVLEQLFPFSLVLDSDLIIRRCAPRLGLTISGARVGASFESIFELVSPTIDLSLESIRSRPRDVFTVKVRSVSGLVLRGQFLVHPSPDGATAIIFVAAPSITDLSQLNEWGLGLHDLPPHDPRGELLVILDEQRVELERKRALIEHLSTTAEELVAKSGTMGVELGRRSGGEDTLRQSQMTESLSRLARGFAHDLNNILLAIDGYASIALSSLSDPNQAGSALKLIRTASDRAAALTKQFLTSTRARPIEPTAIDIAQSIRESVARLGPHTQGRVEVKIDAPDGLGYAWADHTALQQIVTNLSENSLDAMPDGGTLTVSLKVSAKSPGPVLAPSGFFELSIADTGMGMDEQTKARIFEPFFTTKVPSKGAGLGLSTVHELVEQCGGSISVVSELRKGTTFRILLPRVVDKTDPKAVSAAAVPESRPKVLLVEDDPVIRHLLTQLLFGAGYDVSVSAAPEDALAMLGSRAEVDLVITDVVLPEMSGPEMIRKAEAIRGPFRTLYISGHSTDPMLRPGNLPPRSRFLRKPFPPLDLLREVKLTLQCPLS